MRYNTKISLWTAAGLLILAGAVSADGPDELDVGIVDLTEAGVPGASEVQPSDDRFLPPVEYFRSDERLSDADAKKDCADCADLIAIYVADAPTPPGWHSEKSQQFVRVGARLQLRAYIPEKRRIVTVTAVSESTVRKLSKHLVDKFSK
jgi:hypothetical protein